MLCDYIIGFVILLFAIVMLSFINRAFVDVVTVQANSSELSRHWNIRFRYKMENSLLCYTCKLKVFSLLVSYYLMLLYCYYCIVICYHTADNIKNGKSFNFSENLDNSLTILKLIFLNINLSHSFFKLTNKLTNKLVK